jgi:peptide alpha-N-acetyltransferase
MKAMTDQGAEELVLETEVSNTAALSLYESFGFIRDKLLASYYLNGADAFRLKLWLRLTRNF